MRKLLLQVIAMIAAVVGVLGVASAAQATPTSGAGTAQVRSQTTHHAVPLDWWIW